MSDQPQVPLVGTHWFMVPLRVVISWQAYPAGQLESEQSRAQKA
jgi:hypothetical protein